MRLPFAMVSALAVGMLAGCGGGGSDANAPDSPPGPVYNTASELLAAAEDAGVTVCRRPQEATLVTRAYDQLTCNPGSRRFLSARILANPVDQAYDIDGQRELAWLDQRHDEPPQGLLYNTSGQPSWLLVGPLDEIKAAADEIGGEFMDLSLPENALKPTGP